MEEFSSDASVVCHSYHLTSFAVLVSIHEPEKVCFAIMYIRTVVTTCAIGNRG